MFRNRFTAFLAIVNWGTMVFALRPVFCHAEDRFQSPQFAHLDRNRDGWLTLDEFLAGDDEDQRLRLTRDFRVLDFDRNNRFSAEEFSLTLGLSPSSEDRGHVPDPFADLSGRAVTQWRSIFEEADRDRNGRLTRAEWPAAKMKAAFGVPGEEGFDHWDRDRSGEVDLEEGIWFFEVAYGLCRPDGRPLRTPTGFVIDWSYFQNLDTDHDGAISRAEFVARHYAGPEKSADIFARIDADRNGVASFDEIRLAPEFAVDILEWFFEFDADLDGLLSESEIKARARPWQRAMASRLVGAFDGDADHRLSLHEFRATPFANFGADWYRRRNDTDSDGRLSFQEFYAEEAPFLIGQSALFFKEFDRNRDGFLSLAEFDFDVNWQRVPEKFAFRSRDLNGDGLLTLDELFAERPPAEGDLEAARKHRRRRKIYTAWFGAADSDGNGRLTATEFSVAFPGFSPSAFSRFVDLDANADEGVSTAEFVAGVEESKKRDAIRIFRVIDSNADGRLTSEELAQIPDFSRPQERGVIPDPVVDWMEGQLAGLLEVWHALDRNDDGIVPLRDWASNKWQAVVPGLAATTASAWDRNHDGNITESECRFMLEMAFGIRRRDGQLLRDRTGRVVNLPYFRSLDKNGDDNLSKDEFISGYWAGPERSAQVFVQVDTNGDGLATYKELWTSGTLTRDIVKMYFEFDTNFDGYVNELELVAGVTRLQQPLATHLMRGWDTDGDGRLSLYEFRATPIANPLADWHFLRTDQDSDGKLSWNEFYAEHSPVLAGLSREFFGLFDFDQNGVLTYDELEFRVDFNKVPLELAFQVKDTDRDGKLTLAEVFTEPPPPEKNAAAVEQYQRRLARAETRFLADDVNRDGALDFEEYARSQQAARTAAVRRSAALTQAAISDRSTWSLPLLFGINGALLVGAVWHVLRRKPGS